MSHNPYRDQPIPHHVVMPYMVIAEGKGVIGHGTFSRVLDLPPGSTSDELYEDSIAAAREKYSIPDQFSILPMSWSIRMNHLC